MELQKHNFVEQLMQLLQDEKPVLYKMANPTELQITWYLKRSAKVIIDNWDKYTSTQVTT